MDDLVILGGPPYDTDANQTSLQMLQQFGQFTNVLYVCRRQQSSALKRLFTRGPVKKTDLVPGLLRLDDSRSVLFLPRVSEWLPTVYPEVFRLLQLHIIRRAVDKAMRELRFGRTSLLSYWWMFPEIVQEGKWSTRIFDLIDRHWGYEDITSPHRAHRHWQLALETARNSLASFAVSTALTKELTEAGINNIDVLPNGVDLARVHKVLSNSTPRDRGKLAVYCGGWNERIDVELVRHLVTRNSDWDFIFIGSHPEVDFKSLSNVSFRGNLSYNDALAIMGTATIGLVPFVKNEYTESSNFLKVLDYLACGLHVGGSRLTSLLDWQLTLPARIGLCSNIGEWNALFDQIDQSLHPPVLKPGVQNVELSQWDTASRARAILTKIDSQ